MEKIRVLIADDHALVREGLRLMLSSFPEIEIVGEARDGREAVEKAASLEPDVVLMDFQMPVMDGLEAVKVIKEQQPAINVIMLTIHGEDEYVTEAIMHGASGYVLKSVTKEELIKIIEKINDGESFVQPEVTKGLLKQFVAQKRTPREKVLTGRELEVLQFMADGNTNKEIARELNLSVQTVKSHVRNIFEKLETVDRAQAVAVGLRKHLVK